LNVQLTAALMLEPLRLDGAMQSLERAVSILIVGVVVVVVVVIIVVIVVAAA